MDRKSRTPKLKHICKDCSVEFMAFQVNQVRCKTCQVRLKNTRKKLYTKACSLCGEQFHPRDNRSASCEKCRKTFPCQICGKMTKRTGTGQKYCSARCTDISKAEFYYGGNYLAAFKKCDNKCLKCGTNKELHVHHIDGSGRYKLDEGRNNKLDNLIILCNKCHQTLHRLTHSLLMRKYKKETQRILDNFLSG